MSIETLKERIPEFAKDVRLNLTSMASDETLGEQTKYGLLVATAIATRNPDVVAAIEAEAAAKLSPAAMTAARNSSKARSSMASACSAALAIRLSRSESSTVVKRMALALVWRWMKRARISGVAVITPAVPEVSSMK